MSTRVVTFHMNMDLWLDLRAVMLRLSRNGETPTFRAVCEGLIKDGLASRTDPELLQIAAGVAVNRGRVLMPPAPAQPEKATAERPGKPEKVTAASLGWGKHKKR